MEVCDYLIVGAGIAGASAGYFLIPHGRVVLLEKEDMPGYHTTGRSAAFFAETYGNEQVRALTRASRDFFFAPPADFTDTPLLHYRGAVYVARADQMAELENFAREKDLPLTRGENFAQLKPGYMAGYCRDEGCHDIDVHALHQGYLRGIRAGGGEILTKAPLDGADPLGDGWLVRAGGREIKCRVLINAAGAWGDEVAKICGAAPLGLVPKRRTVITFDPDGGAMKNDAPLTLDVEDDFYFKPESGGILLSPCDETPSVPCDSQPDEMDVARALDHVEQVSPFRCQRIRRKWAGLRNFLADRSPAVGFDEKISGFFWCVGQGGFGIQTSPAIGRMVADIIAGNGEADAGISPARFSKGP